MCLVGPWFYLLDVATNARAYPILNLLTLLLLALVANVQAGLASRSYTVGLLSDKEQRIREFHSLIRALIPVSRSPTAPETGSVARRNREMAAE